MQIVKNTSVNFPAVCFNGLDVVFTSANKLFLCQLVNRFILAK